MQAVKDKLNDMSATRKAKAKAEAKAEEKAEKDIAKIRVKVAHEVRLAREAEAAMELHVAKAGHKAEKEMEKHQPHLTTHQRNVAAAAGTNIDHHGQDNCGTNSTGAPHPHLL